MKFEKGLFETINNKEISEVQSTIKLLKPLHQYQGTISEINDLYSGLRVKNSKIEDYILKNYFPLIKVCKVNSPKFDIWSKLPEDIKAEVLSNLEPYSLSPESLLGESSAHAD